METSLPSEGRAGSETTDLVALPAAVAQQAFWFLDQLAPGNPAFNVAVRFRLAGPLKADLVTFALNEILRRHEVLRTRFEEDDGELLQVVLPSVEIEVPVLDLSHLSDVERKAEAERLGSLEAQAAFDLRQAPLFRASLLRLDKEDHILQITVHHAVSDGWSIGLITDELGVLYEAFANGESSPLPDLPIQFGDYSLWQQEYFRGPEIGSQLEYWKRRLKDFVELIPPSDHARPEVKTWKGDIVSLMLPKRLTDRLKEIAQHNGATLSMLFCAAFKVLLCRFTGQTDISIGTPIVGRTRVEVEKLIGVFINTVVLRTDLSANPSFNQFLRSVRDTFLEALENQDVPFELLVKELMPQRDLGRNPLFQVNFTHQRDFVKPTEFGGVQLTALPSRAAGAIFDLHFFMVEREEVWRASCDFNVDLFERDTAARMLACFQQLLESVAADPETSINELVLLPADDRQRMLRDWNSTDREYPRDTTIHALFEKQARNNPARIAIRCANDGLTYAELDQKAGRLASKLKQLGVGRGSFVGLCVERSVGMVVGVLGILKAGAAYVPMDPSFPSERLGFMVEDTGMPVIVTQKSVLRQLPPHGANMVLIDGELPEASADSDPPLASAGDLAYVIFTSGSTGRPKGVKITHRAVVNFLNSMRREPGLTPDDVVLSVTTLSFDIAGLELHLPLTTGATVVVATQDAVSDAELLVRELERTGTTLLQATPVTWRMLLESGWKGNPRLKALVGGESVPRDLVNRLAPLCASLWNMYGPTETTIWSTVGRLEAGDGVSSIGRPIDNTRIYVVDPSIHLQPIGVPGELLIGGEGLADGYLKRDQLTAEKFIPDPFGGRPGSRLYRTGDLARWRADGTLECLGRMDQQVKIRGSRIELGEIETLLASHPDVKQNVVVVREDSPGEKKLVGYFVPANGRNPEVMEFRKHLQRTLPDYMVPSVYVPLTSVPLTPNGKIDRKALPAPDISAVTVSRESIAPRNPAEERLAAIFAKVLGTPIASIHDSFFDLGGHSLMAVKLMASIEKKFRVRLPLARLFDSPTIAQLAEALAKEPGKKNQWNSLVPISPQDGKTPFFLVHGAGGNVLLYREMVQALGRDLSVYGFQSQGLDRKAQPQTKIEDMAAWYVRELRAFQPSGPYHLAGYCMGGAVVYEMARILHQAGQTVGLVALLDTYNLSTIRHENGMSNRFSLLRQRIGFHIDNLAQLRGKDLFGYLSEKLRMAEEAGLGKIAARLKGLKNGLEGTAEDPGAEVFIQEINHQAAWDFVPQPFEESITVFRPGKNYDFFPDPNLGWSELVGGQLDVVSLPANPHAMLIEPFASQLAAELKWRIRRYAGEPADALSAPQR